MHEKSWLFLVPENYIIVHLSAHAIRLLPKIEYKICSLLMLMYHDFLEFYIEL